jgi:hypothetical protein
MNFNSCEFVTAENSNRQKSGWFQEVKKMCGVPYEIFRIWDAHGRIVSKLSESFRFLVRPTRFCIKPQKQLNAIERKRRAWWVANSLRPRLLHAGSSP